MDFSMVSPACSMWPGSVHWQHIARVHCVLCISFTFLHVQAWATQNLFHSTLPFSICLPFLLNSSTPDVYLSSLSPHLFHSLHRSKPSHYSLFSSVNYALLIITSLSYAYMIYSINPSYTSYCPLTLRFNTFTQFHIIFCIAHSLHPYIIGTTLLSSIAIFILPVSCLSFLTLFIIPIRQGAGIEDWRMM